MDRGSLRKVELTGQHQMDPGAGEWWEDDRERPAPVQVPHTALSEDALQGVIASFVLREGTDYGEREIPHATKVAHVLRQLERGEVQIQFDPLDGSVTIVATRPGLRHTEPGA